ncbi:hypothetical protein [Oceaniglobus trochenteri]|uniref:hypothetical protein n=1 Tax=Oceaniglobus trochenteri TaxID=2763260 RepID=UPI001CFF580D|nr:hypothetical protein [Oceaniglobus trochenteri]
MTTPTAIEIVTYRLKPGVDPAQHLQHAMGTRDGVAARAGFRRRQLSCDDTGLWTDHIEWASLADARAAAQSLGDIPGFAAFGADIDDASVDMRHATLHMGAEA